jgi:copper chaperone CopZ
MSSKLDKMDNKATPVKVKSSQPDKVKLDKLDDKSAPDELQGRDTIYIDTDDDITSIIEKVKKSDSPVVALVPPARVSTLQSVVNLKLLQRAAKASRKKLTLITSDRALIGLAAGLKIPVAKSVNAQAEIPISDTDEIPGDDIIDGNDLAIGELANLGEEPIRNSRKEDKAAAAAVKSIETDDRIKNDHDADGVPDDQPAPPEPSPRKKVKGKKVPNFDKFRKRLFIFGGLGVALIAFLVWAIFFASHGTITVKAQTASADISTTVTLSSSNTDVKTGVISPIIKQKKNNESIEFTATGTKEIGEKATGTVVIYNDNSIAPLNISAGTTLASGNLYFVLNADVVVPGVTGSLTNPKSGVSKSVGVTAANIGSEYNIDKDKELSVAGYTSKVFAVADKDFNGGSKETAKVVQQSDIDLATEKLKNQLNETKMKEELTSQMSDDTTVIPDSFTVEYGQFASSPAVDQPPSSGKQPTLTVEVTYTLIGVSNDDLNALLNAQLNDKIGESSGQKIYSNGFKSVQFKNFQATGSGFSVVVSAVGKLGPKLDEEKIKEMAVGKRSGEIRETLNKIDGVSDVEVKFSPFWVRSVSKTDRLTVNFAVDE